MNPKSHFDDLLHLTHCFFLTNTFTFSFMKKMKTDVYQKAITIIKILIIITLPK